MVSPLRSAGDHHPEVFCCGAAMRHAYSEPRDSQENVELFENAMATWQELSLDSLEAARVLLSARHLRSSVSRAYYAAYAATAHHMAKQAMTFPRGWRNPSHDQVLSWISTQRKWPANQRRQLTKAIRRLRRAREDADYRPGVSLAKADLVGWIKDALLILGFLDALP